ncbi:MAG: dihydrolipoyl dehydrogenase [Treponema sp.]|jgi:dihydrolipoamide dehydrogenase|nr:dihydrolipoyl dehydrogenase [Treponema sp.]
MAETFDAAVIGGGPGGYICAIRCARLGLKTALVENRELGGTCLNRGCIPTKALLHTAELYDEVANHGKELGLAVNGITVDYAALANRKDMIITRLRRGIEGLIKGRKITLIQGTAVLTGSKTFSVTPSAGANSASDYTADSIVLATGSEPASIPVPGAVLPGVINSDDFLALKEIPDSTVIIGGGVIGIEFATLLSSLGKKVTIVEMLPNILNGMDDSVCDTVSNILKNRGVAIHCPAKLCEIKASGSALSCTYEEGGGKQEASGSMVIMAVGRKPLTKNLGLESANIAAVKGFVTVDEYLRANVPNIYAIGDITGKVQLAHVASAQGMVAASNIAGKNIKMRYDIIPACVYTNPEAASVGMTEAAVKAAGLPYKTGSFPAIANGRSLIMHSTEGFVKMLTHKETGEILGAHIVAPRATDLIGEIAAAMRAEATIEELADTIHAHPTVNEMIMEAAHDVEGLCCHKM